MRSKAIEKFCADYKRLEAKRDPYSWAALDRALGGVCADMPCHISVDEVFAKVAIINRTYRANLQLAAPEAEWKVAKQLVMARADRILDPLRRFSEFSCEALTTVLGSHEQLVKIAHKVTKRSQNSFISKYLHFHFPDVVPIFDSYSYDKTWTLAPLTEAEWAQYDRRLNRHYCFHCGSLLQIIDELQGRGVAAPSVKLLDVLLYGSP